VIPWRLFKGEAIKYGRKEEVVRDWVSIDNRTICGFKDGCIGARIGGKTIISIFKFPAVSLQQLLRSMTPSLMSS
jgi:hypothetical protein